MKNCQEERLRSLNEKFPALDLQNQRYVIGIINALSFATEDFNPESNKNQQRREKAEKGERIWGTQ